MHTIQSRRSTRGRQGSTLTPNGVPGRGHWALLVAVAFVLGLAASTSVCLAQPSTISSEFTSGTEGWTTVTVTGVLTALNVCGSVGGPFSPDYVPSGGNPGGYISETDSSFSNTFFFSAPGSVLVFTLIGVSPVRFCAGTAHPNSRVPSISCGSFFRPCRGRPGWRRCRAAWP